MPKRNQALIPMRVTMEIRTSDIEVAPFLRLAVAECDNGSMIIDSIEVEKVHLQENTPMSSHKLDPAIERAAVKLGALMQRHAGAAAASTTGSFLISLVKSIVLPILPLLLTEILKGDTTRKYTKVLTEARDVLDQANLGDA